VWIPHATTEPGSRGKHGWLCSQYVSEFLARSRPRSPTSMEMGYNSFPTYSTLLWLGPLRPRERATRSGRNESDKLRVGKPNAASKQTVRSFSRKRRSSATQWKQSSSQTNVSLRPSRRTYLRSKLRAEEQQRMQCTAALLPDTIGSLLVARVPGVAFWL
jgi:hypothetical protein